MSAPAFGSDMPLDKRKAQSLARMEGKGEIPSVHPMLIIRNREDCLIYIEEKYPWLTKMCGAHVLWRMAVDILFR